MIIQNFGVKVSERNMKSKLMKKIMLPETQSVIANKTASEGFQIITWHCPFYRIAAYLWLTAIFTSNHEMQIEYSHHGLHWRGGRPAANTLL